MKLLKYTIAGFVATLLLAGCGNEEKKSFYEDGKIKQVAFYDGKNQLQDSFKIYGKDGNVITDLIYKDGKVISGFKIDNKELKINDLVLNGTYKYTYVDGKVTNVEKDEKYEKEIIQLLRIYPESITQIDNQTPEMQITAFKSNPKILRNIKDQSLELQKFALKNNYKYIANMPNQSEEMQLFFVSLYVNEVVNLINPSEKVMVKAIELNPDVIMVFAKQNPSEKVKKSAIEKNGELIRYINNPSEELQLIAINKDVSCLRFISNPTNKVIETAVIKDAYAIGFVNNLSLELQEKIITNDKTNAFKIGRDKIDQNLALKLVEEDIKFFTLLKNPKKEILEKLISGDLTREIVINMGEIPEDIQLAIIRKNWTLFRFITNPTDNVILEAIALDINNFKYIKANRQTEEMHLKVADKDSFIRYISNPSKKVRLLLAKHRGFLNFFGRDASEEEILINFENFGPSGIRYVDNQTIEVQKEAIRLGGKRIYNLIKNPGEEAKALMK